MTQRPGYTYHEVTLTLGTAQYADVDKLETKRRSAARDKALGRH